MLLDVRVCVANGLDLFGVLVGDLDIELFFETHHKLHQVERIGSEVFDKAGIFGNFCLVDAELVDDDLFDLILNF